MPNPVLKKENKIITITQWLVLIGVVSSLYIGAGTLFLALLLLLFTNKLVIKKNVYIPLFIAYIFISSIITIFVNNYPFDKFFQQFVLITCFIIGYFLYLSSIKEYINSFFNKYLKFMVFISFFGVVQYVIYRLTGRNIFGFINTTEWGDYNFRVTSFLTCEPARFANILSAALFYYFVNYKITQKLFSKIVVLLAYLLTFSFTANIILMIMFIILAIMKFKKFVVLSIPILLIGTISFYLLNEYNAVNRPYKESSSKILLQVFTDFSLYNIENLNRTNLSVYAITKNTWVSLNSPSRLFGTGLGTHEFSHDRLIRLVNPIDSLNKQDAYSLGVRVFSELGLVGIFLLILFLVKFSNFKNLINFSVFFILLSLILRGGHYASNGTILFFFLYYFTGRESV